MCTIRCSSCLLGGCLRGVCVCPGRLGLCPRGLSVCPGGVCPVGVCLVGCLPRGCLLDTPLPCGQNDRRNYVADGNKWSWDQYKNGNKWSWDQYKNPAKGLTSNEKLANLPPHGGPISFPHVYSLCTYICVNHFTPDAAGHCGNVTCPPKQQSVVQHPQNCNTYYRCVAGQDPVEVMYNVTPTAVCGGVESSEGNV